MLRSIGRGAALTLLLATGLTACRPAEKDRIALVGATVFDGSGGSAMPDAVIVVRGRKIESIAPRSGFQIPKTAETVDVTGKWIIPGLIDAHVHARRWMLPRLLAYGVTAVRDLGGPQDSVLALREEANLAGIESPRMYVAGAAIDGAPPTWSGSQVGVTNPDQARRAVDEHAVAGVDLIKTYVKLTPALLRPLLDEVKTFQLPVTAHLGLTDALTAAKLGVGSIEHLSGVPEAAVADPAKFYAAHRTSFWAGWNYFERSWAGLDSAALSRVARGLADAHVVLVPTLVVHDAFSRMDDPALLNDPGLKVMPDSEIAKWNVPDLKSRAGWSDADYVAFRKSRPMQDLFLREFRAAGGVIVTGSDLGNQMIVPGYSIHQELALLVNAGLTPADALLAATHNAAVLLGADSLGTLAPGQSADLVVLGGDPLADIGNTKRVEQVMIRGLLLASDSIRAGW